VATIITEAGTRTLEIIRKAMEEEVTTASQIIITREE
jgi:hypothetical protein